MAYQGESSSSTRRRMVQQEVELEMLRKRLEEIESSQGDSSSSSSSSGGDGSGFAKRLMSVYGGDEDPGMVKSMDLDMSDLEPLPRQFEIVGDAFASKLGRGLSTVYEEEEEEESEEVEKSVVVVTTTTTESCCPREVRIQNIFTLCGNNRELCRQMNGESGLNHVEEERSITTTKGGVGLLEQQQLEEEEEEEECKENNKFGNVVGKWEKEDERSPLSPLDNKFPLSPAILST